MDEQAELGTISVAAIAGAFRSPSEASEYSKRCRCLSTQNGHGARKAEDRKFQKTRLSKKKSLPVLAESGVVYGP